MLARTLHRNHLATVVLAAIFGGGCEADFSGFDDLLDPAPTFVNFPGRQVTNRRTTLPGVEGTDAGGAMIVAFEQDSPRLLIFPFEGGSGCSPGPADRFGIFPYGLDSSLTPYFPFREPGGSPVHLVGPGCEEPFAPLEGVRLPFDLSEPFRDPPGYLASTADSQLLFLQPWTKTITTVIENLDRGFRVELLGNFGADDPDLGHIWTVEGGQIVGRNREFAEFARYGSNVREFTVTSLRERIAYIEGNAGEAAGGDLYLVDVGAGAGADAEPEQIDQNACGVSFPAGWASSGVSYFAPCATRRLVLYEIARARAAEEEDAGRFVYHENVVGSPRVDRLEVDRLEKPFVFFYTAEDPRATVGELWGVRFGGVPQRLSANARVLSAPISTGDKFQLLVDYDSERETNRLVEWQPGTPPVELLREVITVQRPLVIANYDGTVGDAYRVDLSGRTRRLAAGVPARGGIVNNDIGTAILTEYDGASGTLIAQSADGGGFEPIARKVAPRTFGFIPDIGAIAYVREYDAELEVGLLGVRVLETADTFDIDLVATNWNVTFWPEPGVFYTVASGPTRGLWFARLK